MGTPIQPAPAPGSSASPGTPASPGLTKPRQPLSPREQLEAARKVQAAAEHRVKLSLKLFQAAEARTVHNQKLLEQFKAAQNDLRRELQQDVAASLRDYDQWMGRIDESFTTKIREMEQRLDSLQTSWDQAQHRVEDMLHRTESMLQETRAMVEKIERAAPPEGSPVPDAPPTSVDGAPPAPPLTQPGDNAPASPIYGQLLQRLQDRAADEEAA